VASKKTARSEAPADGVVQALKARYPGKVFRGGEYTMPWMMRRLPTGVIGLDCALHGGLPAGGLSVIRGPEGVGKNWLANQVIANQQRLHGAACTVAVINTEMVYDKLFARACGIQVALSAEELEYYCRAYHEGTGEDPPAEVLEELQHEVGTFLTTPPLNAEDAFDLAIDIIKQRVFNVVVIDSFGSLLVEEEEDKSFNEEARVGGTAKLNTQFARKLNSAMAPDSDGRPNLTCIVGLNQMRDNMSRANKYSPLTQEGGGRALKHSRWVTVDLVPAGKLRVPGKSADKIEAGAVIGKVVRWTIEKQKAGGHEGAAGTYDYVWARTGIDRCKEAVRAAEECGVFKRAGTWFSYGQERVGQGLAAATEWLRAGGPDLLAEVEGEILRAAGVHCNYT